MTLNPLAFPKGVKLECELCHRLARLQCTNCRVTYYCCPEHQAADWVGIHEQICQQLIALRQPLPFLPSKEDRLRKEQEILQQKLKMIEFTRLVGQKLLFEGKFEEAVPAAIQCLNFSVSVYGTTGLELVPAYLILSEASIGLQRTAQAEEYLAQAQWTVLKAPSATCDLKHRLYRNLGLLYAAKGQKTQALFNFSEDIYRASETYGTDNIHTSGGYFHMANIFLRQRRPQVAIADSLFRQVAQIWHAHLMSLFKSRTRIPPTPPGVGPGAVEPPEPELEGLDEAQEAEAITVLKAICQFREECQSPDPRDVIVIYHALAMLYFLMGHRKQAKQYAKKALSLQTSHTCQDLCHQVEEFLDVLARVK